eukprot:Awhi_evm1s7574
MLTIDLSGRGLKNEDLELLPILFQENKVTSINLSNNLISEVGAKLIGNILLVEKQSIMTINLGNNLIEDDGVKHIMDALNINKKLKLTFLNLDHNGIDDD